MDPQTAAYIEREGLDRLIEFDDGTLDDAEDGVVRPFAPEAEDLVRLHRLIRQRRSFTVLEFGLGYSTLVIADALRKNEQDWLALADAPAIRNRHLFHCFCVDTSHEWIELTANRFDAELLPYVSFRHSAVKIGTFNDRICHFYETLPDVVADFIYLDGPSPQEVQGSVNGLSFQCDERTVMAADLLLMEPTMLPGTCILVDGRTNNARFLANNFQRDFTVTWDRSADVTTFILDEDRLGPHNLLGSDFLPDPTA